MKPSKIEGTADYLRIVFLLRIDYCGLGPILNNGSIFGTVTWI